jgi:hypothetical protein
MLLNGVKSTAVPDRALPLDLRLRAIADNVPAARIDELWVFPPLPNRDVSCEFLVLVCYDGGEDRRRILTSHVDAQYSDPDSDEFEWVQRVREHGTAPHSWVSDMPERLLQRLSDAGVPDVVEVGGKLEAWEEAVERFASTNGNGNRSVVKHVPVEVDSRFQREISFSTVIESSIAGNGAETESDS